MSSLWRSTPCPTLRSKLDGDCLAGGAIDAGTKVSWPPQSGNFVSLSDEECRLRNKYVLIIESEITAKSSYEDVKVESSFLSKLSESRSLSL